MKRVSILLMLTLVGQIGCGRDRDDQEQEIPPVPTADQIINPGAIQFPRDEKLGDDRAP